MTGIDPEPDRAEKAATPSPEWDKYALFAKLLEVGESIRIPGCEQGLHDFTNEYTGDPPGAQPRTLSWSTTRVQCSTCGQRATLVYDPAPAAPAAPYNPRSKVFMLGEIREALRAGRDGSQEYVSIQEVSAASLYAAVRLAWRHLEQGPGPAAEDGSGP